MNFKNLGWGYFLLLQNLKFSAKYLRLYSHMPWVCRPELYLVWPLGLDSFVPTLLLSMITLLYVPSAAQVK